MSSNEKTESTVQRIPTPPPIPPPPASHDTKRGRPSAYLASPAAAGPDFTNKISYAPKVDEPAWYFFYGTLTKPEILKHILDLHEEPLMRPAKIIGYALSSWGQYRALIDGEPEEEVSGFAYEVQTTEHEFKLARYETNAYKLHSCRIRFTDDKEPGELSGNTFMYAGDAAALRAGRFDRMLWELQMGTRLPDKWKTSTDSKGAEGSYRESKTEIPVNAPNVNATAVIQADFRIIVNAVPLDRVINTYATSFDRVFYLKAVSDLLIRGIAWQDLRKQVEGKPVTEPDRKTDV
ncbi:hypothetical protein O1611_g1650 [Lasiodiplodia mahajangana]|uniref:Uncharacterized protein n=1 Tax=Lasiodiplodia mahajangana TaxID=1108764 RepID=A0ACC2JWY1_9PEZI|nr:hypothetical protein O1611_g1650 [Lasiodiplodia mahajangana]